ncbi:hypothetical protein FOPE_10914 [Fonsecaea pedrosoi]|nr:hypothetical protein FOPE_10914 [Fonsecaea pedrosoi]
MASPAPAPLTRSNLRKLHKMTASAGPVFGFFTRSYVVVRVSRPGSRIARLKDADFVMLNYLPPAEIEERLQVIWARPQSDEKRQEVAHIPH